MRYIKRNFINLLVSITMIVSLAACSNANSDIPAVGGDAAGSEKVTITDQAGREVVIEDTVKKIVSAYYISSSTCIALGLEEKLVGIEAKADSRPIYAMAAPKLLELPNVGTAKEFNLEGCIALEPDLVIMPKRLKESADDMTALGIPVLLVSPENHQDLVEMINLIGTATGTEENAAKLVDHYQDELSAVAELTKDIAEKPVTYMGGNSDYLETSPKDMYQASLIEAAGGVNAAQEIDGDNWVKVSYEQIIAMNPEVIIIPSEAVYSKEDVLNDSQLINVTAVKEGKVYQMPKDFEAWDAPVPSCTLGIRWMLNALHEDVYPIEKLKDDVFNFYQAFYGVEVDINLIRK